MLLVALTSCAAGYRLHQEDGAETLYHIDQAGTQRIVYVVDKDGKLQIHDKNDPIVKRFYTEPMIKTGMRDACSLAVDGKETGHRQLLAAKLIRAGRVTAAKKRRQTDPIFVTVHDAEVGPSIRQFTRGVEPTQKRFKEAVLDELTRDPIITITSTSGDVDVFFKSCFKETAAVNVETHKLARVTAFYFEARVRFNYLPDESYTVRELGHWMDSREVINRAAQRVGKIIKETIGPNIPKDRAKYLPLLSRGV